MFYYLHRLSDQFIGFNVFSYVTFRAVAASVTAFAICLLSGNFVIRKLISLKVGQPIRTAEEVRDIRSRRSSGETIASLVTRFDVSVGIVCSIIYRHTWKHV